jgi:ornithine cyclodeaminase
MDDSLHGDLLVIPGATVSQLLSGRELEIVEVVAAAYLAHERSATALPHSLFLRFPDAPANRIIALPAYLADPWNAAGVKWISSFPENLSKGIDRASAVLILNSADTGHPYAVLEASQISAQRTAASAALAARHLWRARSSSRIGVIGCGPIAFEVVRFIHRTVRPIRTLVAFDQSAANADHFAKRCGRDFGITVEVATSIEAAIGESDLVLFATTAPTPHVHDLTLFAPGTLVLHVSLRDLAPEIILASDNIVDDVDHVCRAETSVHLAEKTSGNRGFIRATLAQIVAGNVSPHRNETDVTVFSPFGLGVLDLAVAQFVTRAATGSNVGVRVPSFLAEPWRATQLL